LKAAKTKPVEITMWHSMTRANEETLQKLVGDFNSSQGDVKVDLVNQIDYVQTFNKYKAGLGTGDLPDIVQLQESEQRQMIDTQTVLPAGVCAKADKYPLDDFLPRDQIRLLDSVQHPHSWSSSEIAAFSPCASLARFCDSWLSDSLISFSLMRTDLIHALYGLAFE